MNDATFIAVNRTGRDDLVLEDTIEETETIVGHGQANIFTAPDEKTARADTSESTKANKRAHRQQLLSDRGVSLKVGNINATFKEKEVSVVLLFICQCIVPTHFCVKDPRILT